MSEVVRGALGIARMGWRASFNRTWRFSKMKFGAFFLVLQLVFIYFVATRSPARLAAGQQELDGLFALFALQMGWFGLMFGFSRGQQQLYQGLLVPLFQLSPTRPIAVLLGRVIETVPTRLWSCLLWSWAYSSMVAGGERWLVMLGLLLFGLIIGMVAHLSGLLLLTLWSRISPQTMKNGSFLFGALTLGLVTWAVIYLAQGGTFDQIAVGMRTYRIPVFTVVVVLAGIPGLAMLGTMLVRPGPVENLYREGLYKVVELGEADTTRPSRSAWLPIGEPVLRAVLSREWLQLYRSRVFRMQLMVWAASTVGVWAAGRAVAGAPMERVILYVGGLSLFAWFMGFGHWVVRVFEGERRTIFLYRIAAISTTRLLMAKFISLIVPSGILVVLSTMVGAYAAGLTEGEVLTVMGWAFAGLAGGVLAGFGVAALTVGEEPEEETTTATGQVGGAEGPNPTANAWYSLARTLSLVLACALPVWTGAGLPGVPFGVPGVLLVLLNVGVPFALLVLGSVVMVRHWERTA